MLLSFLVAAFKKDRAAPPQTFIWGGELSFPMVSESCLDRKILQLCFLSVVDLWFYISYKLCCLLLQNEFLPFFNWKELRDIDISYVSSRLVLFFQKFTKKIRFLFIRWIGKLIVTIRKVKIGIHVLMI